MIVLTINKLKKKKKGPFAKAQQILGRVGNINVTLTEEPPIQHSLKTADQIRQSAISSFIDNFDISKLPNKLPTNQGNTNTKQDQLLRSVMSQLKIKHIFKFGSLSKFFHKNAFSNFVWKQFLQRFSFFFLQETTKSFF